MSSREETRRRGVKKQQTAKRQFARMQTRKQKKEKEGQEAKEKRVANLFQRIVGVTAARGYNRNLRQNVGLVSKAVSQNVLLEGAQKKRVKMDESNKILKEILKYDLSYMYSMWKQAVKYTPKNEPQFKKDLDDTLNRIHQILQSGGTMYSDTLGILWKYDSLLIEAILDQNPIVKELSFNNKKRIYDELYKDYKEAKELYNGWIDTLENRLARHQLYHYQHRADRFIPEDVRYKMDEALLKLYRLDAFISSYNADTGDYTLYSSDFDAYFNERETNETINALFENDDEIRNILFPPPRNNNNNNNEPWRN